MVFLPENLKPFSSQEKVNKKLINASRELLNCHLFQLGANAKYSFAEVMKLFVDASIKHSSAEAICKKGNYPSADDAFAYQR